MTDTTMTAAEEKVLTDRDEQVAAKLRARIEAARERARELRHEASEEETEANRIEEAARKEQWWRLAGILGADEIESLSNISPTDLLGDFWRQPALLAPGW